MTEPHVVGSVLYGADLFVAQMVSARLPQPMAGRLLQFDAAGRPLFAALGVVRRGELLGGVVYHNYHGHIIEASFAFDRPDWCLPGTLQRLFAYPFVDLGCVVMVTTVGRKNKRSRRITRGLGFFEMGFIPHGFDGKEDAFIYFMQRDKCRWLSRRAPAAVEPEMT